MTRLYFAGPLFTTAERDFNKRLAAVLREVHCHSVLLPQESEQKGVSQAAAIFKGDVWGIDTCEVVVANMDGPDPDSGTCWECGYAFAKGKSVVLYRTDIRDEEPFGPFNLMLHQGAAAVLDCKWLSVAAISDMIDEALRRLPCYISPR